MTPFLTVVLVVFLVGILIPKKPKIDLRVYGASVKLPYLVFILTLASSPIIGTMIGNLFGRNDNTAGFLQYLWIGIALSLPLSLITARMFGPINLVSYWRYLESFGGHSKAVIVFSWGLATVVAIGSALAIALVT